MKIFISLAKEDYKWAQSINDYAFRIPSLKQLEIWSAALDGLDNSDNWKNTITTEIDECDGAIILLSKASIKKGSYCFENEIPQLLERKDIKIKFFTLDECNYQEIEKLQNIQLENSPSKPLDEISHKVAKGYIINALSSFIEIIDTTTKSTMLRESFLRVSHIDEGKLINSSWRTEYLPGGGILKSEPIMTPSELIDKSFHKRINQQIFIAKKDSPQKPVFSKEVFSAITTLKKILQRGDGPPLDPDTEKSILDEVGIKSFQSPFDGDLSREVEEFTFKPSSNTFFSVWKNNDEFESRFNTNDFGPDLLFNSQEEINFYKYFDGEPFIQRWLHPQFPMRELLKNTSDFSTIGTEDNRRVDFLFAPPWREPLIIEILGGQHFKDNEDENEPSTSSDFQSRKNLLRYETIGISAKETFESSHGENLNQAKKMMLEHTLEENTDIPLKEILFKVWETTSLNTCLLEAIQDGFLRLNPDEDWVVGIEKVTEGKFHGVSSFLNLLSAVAYIWDVDTISPNSLTITDLDGKNAMTWKRSETDFMVYEVNNSSKKLSPDLYILLEPNKSYLEKLDLNDVRISNKKVIISRTSSLPYKLTDTRPQQDTTPVIKEGDEKNLQESLGVLLKFIFSKENFREGQFTSIQKILNKEDVLLLLPTGAGKSLVYQLVSFVLPGRVLVVDPINALMEDQEYNLKRNGVDRVIAINSETYRDGSNDRDEMLVSVERGDNLIMLVAPERLLIPDFNEALRSLISGGVPISLVVFDEAHCISEWGHDFRTSYLGIGERIKKLCKEYGDEPTILAMTGTASQPVVRDILIEGEIKEEEDGSSIVSASSYRRDELNFSIDKCIPDSKERVLKTIIKKKIPQFLQMRSQEVFIQQPDSRDNHLGIIFTKTKPEMIKLWRILNADPEVSMAGIGMYFGSQGPGRQWPSSLGDPGEYKKKVVKQFKNGDIRIMISTKAFGMGIDIPNIRYVIHYGITGSLEAWYQEAGRAGRNRLNSSTTAIFSEIDEDRSNSLLSGEDGETLRLRHKSLSNNEKWGDDVAVNLSFHWLSWAGFRDELSVTRKVLDLLIKEKAVDRDFKGNITIKNVDEDSNFGNKTTQAIYRFKIIGAINDWQRNYRTQSFHLSVPSRETITKFEYFSEWLDRRSPRGSREFINLLKELSETQETFQNGEEVFSTFSKKLNEDLDIKIEDVSEYFKDLNSYNGILLCAVTLSLYVIYESVEFARRTKIKELAEFSRSRTTNNDIHEGFEQYFLDGPAANDLRGLEREGITDVEMWLDVYRKIPKNDKIETFGDINKYRQRAQDFPAVYWWLSFLSVEFGPVVELESNLNEAFRISFLRKDIETLHIKKLWEELYKLCNSNELRAILFNALIKLETDNKSDLYDEEIIDLENEFLTSYIANEKEDSESLNEASLSILNRKLLDVNNIIKLR
jgi:ATP-dependent DNA helicase RecQ